MRLILPVLVILLLACVQVPPDTVERPQEPAPEPELPEEPTLSAPSPESSAGVAIETPLGAIECDTATRRLRVTITNNGVKRWEFSKSVPFPAPKDVVAARLYINDYEATKIIPYIDRESGDALFGPFAQNCGGTSIQPGERLQCTFWPIPIRTADTLRENIIWLDAEGDNLPVRFECV